MAGTLLEATVETGKKTVALHLEVFGSRFNHAQPLLPEDTCRGEERFIGTAEEQLFQPAASHWQQSTLSPPPGYTEMDALVNQAARRSDGSVRIIRLNGAIVMPNITTFVGTG